MHDDKHPLAGKTVKVTTTRHVQIGDGPHEYEIEDWWDHLTGSSWMSAEGNPTCLVYAMRSGFAGLPIDNEVMYGHIGGIGHLVHVSEIMDGENA
jgi:hypothetical protein